MSRREETRPAIHVPPLEVALFAVGLLLAGLVISALAWSGTGPYAALASDNGVDSMSFRVLTPEGGTWAMNVDAVVAIVHEPWVRYVTGGTDAQPQFDHPLFSPDEYAHMADVRNVFAGAKLMIPVGLFVLAIRLQRARATSGAAALRLARDGSLVAAGIVAIIGVVAVFAFEPLFLLFHEVFFPQGNYLFDPATSNLVRLYPDWYWEGITLRVGLSFIATALGIAAVATLALRRVK